MTCRFITERDPSPVVARPSALRLVAADTLTELALLPASPPVRVETERANELAAILSDPSTVWSRTDPRITVRTSPAMRALHYLWHGGRS